VGSILHSKIDADRARFGRGMFDSTLELPSSDIAATQNAWLTLTLRVHLDFIDPPGGGLGNVFTRDGKTYVRDWSGWEFPILRWNPDDKRRYSDYFQKHSEEFWNYRCTLLTPRTYTGLDIANRQDAVIFGSRVRPNVICLFRLNRVASNQSPHKKIHIFNIDPSVRTVKKSSGETTDITTRDSYTFRSDAENYDSMDIVIPTTPVATYHDRTCGCLVVVRHDTIAHEIGHALAQPHIKGLQGDPACSLTAATQGDAMCYDSSPNNVMGRGNEFWPINAYSWQQRVAEHTGTDPNTWFVQMGQTVPQLVSI
jgi:hypothetical protein